MLRIPVGEAVGFRWQGGLAGFSVHVQIPPNGGAPAPIAQIGPVTLTCLAEALCLGDRTTPWPIAGAWHTITVLNKADWLRLFVDGVYVLDGDPLPKDGRVSLGGALELSIEQLVYWRALGILEAGGLVNMTSEGLRPRYAAMRAYWPLLSDIKNRVSAKVLTQSAGVYCTTMGSARQARAQTDFPIPEGAVQDIYRLTHITFPMAVLRVSRECPPVKKPSRIVFSHLRHLFCLSGRQLERLFHHLGRPRGLCRHLPYKEHLGQRSPGGLRAHYL